MLFLATLPGLLVCYVMFRVDKYEREPLLPLAVCFGLGALLTVPAIRVESWWYDFLGLNTPSPRTVAGTFVLAFVVVALWEELLKWGVLLLVAPRRFFNEPLDGIVYSVMIGMGFATVENVVYLERFGPHSLLLRAFTAVPAHLAFAVVQGYYVGLAKFGRRNPDGTTGLLHNKKLIFMGLGLAVLLHGIYDLLIFQQWWQWLFMLATSALYLCLFYCGELIREHLENSPFKKQ